MINPSNPSAPENDPVVWIVALLVVLYFIQRWRTNVWKGRSAAWEKSSRNWEAKYEAIPEEDDDEEMEATTDAELRGQVIGLQGKLEAANSLVSHYKANPDLYWKGKYESLDAETAGYKQAVERELFFLRASVNGDAAEKLKEWQDEDSDR